MVRLYLEEKRERAFQAVDSSKNKDILLQGLTVLDSGGKQESQRKDGGKGGREERKTKARERGKDSFPCRELPFDLGNIHKL